jgi:hypothetical protein
VDAKLEALRTTAMRVWGLVLDNIDRSSSLAVPLSTMVELLKVRIDPMATNRVPWGIRYVLTADLSHFSELKSELELLRFRHNEDLTEDQGDALWTQVRVASDSLVSYVPPSVACNPPENAGD